MFGASFKLNVECLECRDNPSGWSFWDDTYLGAAISGAGQGVANLVNGVQDVGIGLLNLPAVVYNNTAGYVGGGAIGYIPSPDWSRDLIVVNDPLHGTNKFLSGNGIVILVTLGASGALTSSRAAATEVGEASAAASGSEVGGASAGTAVGGDSAAEIETSRMTAYGIAFFFFWLIAALSSAVSIYLMRTSPGSAPGGDD